MRDNIYDINYNKLTGWVTPDPLRKTKLLRLLGLLISPIVSLYQTFLLYRSAKLYTLKITPQKCYLELLLNDRYDFTLRRIYIDDSSDKPPLYIYQHAELKPKFIYRRSENNPRYIYTTGESGDIKNDFIVFVPLDISFELAEMISLLKVYKLAGTKFKIQRF